MKLDDEAAAGASYSHLKKKSSDNTVKNLCLTRMHPFKEEKRISFLKFVPAAGYLGIISTIIASLLSMTIINILLYTLHI